MEYRKTATKTKGKSVAKKTSTKQKGNVEAVLKAAKTNKLDLSYLRE
ncbi:MAG TPA: hypothetical protein PLU36_08365 [Chitinophagaceae bacterium]|nr:hypothetical protein [Chitinophagaceae bacterium]HMZ46801.1 hypothetical protein [Chitinophagaceae bacterium]HNE93403.1 hypothetical protein [Chitinophagaceae bacterium]HNF29341.1 hypothetical protein [Chitinophagaceae bacterium]HNJ59152.1 hypothetical protein [Chitinophagaceae bacterium]